MSSQIPEDPIELIAISDPGEKDKENHLWSDRLVVNVANVVAWLFPVLILAIVSQVILRKMGLNQAWLDDAQWWMYGFAMVVGFAYAITTSSHVRVDILHQHFSSKKKAKVEIFALGWLLLPFLGIMADVLMHYAYSSWVASEGSDSPNGLHKLYLLKMSLPVLFVLAMVAAFSSLYRNLALISKPAIWKICISALPIIWFLCERLSYYCMWWYTHFTQPDLHVRRIPREPLLEYSTWVGLGVMIVVFVISIAKNWQNHREV